VEDVEDRDGIGEFVIDGVGVAHGRVQSGDLHARGELGSVGLEPAGVGRPGERPETRSISRACGFFFPCLSARLVNSTIPVSWLGPFPGRGEWCQMCSSTPSTSTP
jgi:hypothetical protein